MKAQRYATDNRAAFSCMYNGKSEAKVTIIDDCTGGITLQN